MTTLAFRAARYDIAAAGCWLSPVSEQEAVALGAALSEIDPWARYGTSSANLATLFHPAPDGGIRLALRIARTEAPIGGVVIRHPWLTGPYMQFLGVLPGHQGQGLGHAVLAWFEAEARAGGSRNLWICAASFNAGAQRLYVAQGFEQIAVLDSLIKPSFDEVLMRKRLNPGDS